MQKKRTVIADDNQSFRLVLRLLLKKFQEIEVIGEAANGMETLDLVKALSPDLLLLDFDMPLLDGNQVVQRLSADHDPVRILVISAYNDTHLAESLLQAGAAAFLCKEDLYDKLGPALQNLWNGKVGADQQFRLN
jgi:DNA-binding NarL/FixJ family response regulator